MSPDVASSHGTEASGLRRPGRRSVAGALVVAWSAVQVAAGAALCVFAVRNGLHAHAQERQPLADYEGVQIVEGLDMLLFAVGAATAGTFAAALALLRSRRPRRRDAGRTAFVVGCLTEAGLCLLLARSGPDRATAVANVAAAATLAAPSALCRSRRNPRSTGERLTATGAWSSAGSS